MAAHVSSDLKHNLVRTALISTASVQDGHMFEHVAPEDTAAIYADKIYDTKSARAWLRKRGITNGILKKGARHIKLNSKDIQRNHQKGLVRRNIERIFGYLKQWQGYRRVRYLGLAKNQLELTLKAVAYNLKRLVTILKSQSV